MSKRNNELQKKIEQIRELEYSKEVPRIWEGIRFAKYSAFSVKEYLTEDKINLISMDVFYTYLKSLSLKDVKVITIFEPNLKYSDGNKKISIAIQSYINDLLTVNGLSTYSVFDAYRDCIDHDLKNCFDEEQMLDLYKKIKFEAMTFIKEKRVMKE